MKNMNYIRRGYGSPLLLVHGLGGSSCSWEPILNSLAERRDVIAVDLPGFGLTPALDGKTSIATLADALTEFLASNKLLGVDAVGTSMGARLVLELARRQEILGAVVALSPGGFWQGVERHAFYASMYASIRMIRTLEPVLPELVKSKTARAALLAQLARNPGKLSNHYVLGELRTMIDAKSFDELLNELAYGEEQQGASFGSVPWPLMIAWGRQDRVCYPHQAERALQLFPDAKLRWIENSGHLPFWDAPAETVDLIFENMDRKMTCRKSKYEAARTAAHVRSAPYDSPAL